MNKRNNDMKRHCRNIKKTIWMKWRSLTLTKVQQEGEEGFTAKNTIR